MSAKCLDRGAVRSKDLLQIENDKGRIIVHFFLLYGIVRGLVNGVLGCRW